MTFSSTQSRTSARISSAAWSKPCACAFCELGGEVRFGARLTSVLHSRRPCHRRPLYQTRRANRSCPPSPSSSPSATAPAIRSESLLRRRHHAACRSRSPSARASSIRKASSTASQYGAAAGHPALGAADYKLALHLPERPQRLYVLHVSGRHGCRGGQRSRTASSPTA